MQEQVMFCGEPKSKLKDYFNSKHETEEYVIKHNELKEKDNNSLKAQESRDSLAQSKCDSDRTRITNC